MKLMFNILLLMASSLTSLSQNNYNFEFIGTINITDGEILSYKISFNILNNNYIEGYSITDIDGADQTRTLIAGNWDTFNNILSFRELENINTKTTDDDESVFCFISAEELMIKKHNGSRLIKGEFKGLLPSGEYCAEGMIYLVESDIVKKIQSLAIKSAPSSDSLNNSLPPQKSTDKEEVVVLKSNDSLLFEFKNKNIVLEFRDCSVEDGDIIDIYLNDALFKENVLLLNKKQRIRIPIIDSTFKLTVLARNEGEVGINTVNFVVKNGSRTKDFTSKLFKGQSFDIEFKQYQE